MAGMLKKSATPKICRVLGRPTRFDISQGFRPTVIEGFGYKVSNAFGTSYSKQGIGSVLVIEASRFFVRL